jgi:transcriptional regulator with XRE-family HTH domain
MAALRKANGYTQQQIADKLNVSNKTISKWECDDGYPEISMLPAIAEIYGVTVDELLRGEKANQTAEKETNNQKAEEQIKYLIQKSIIKFNNNSIISIVLGVLALVLAYTVCDIIYNSNVLWIGYIIILLLCGASISLSLIAFNDFISNLQNENIIEKEILKDNIQKCINYVSVIIFLAIVTLAGVILDIIFASTILFSLPITMVIGVVIGLLVRSALYKKYGIINLGVSPEKKKYRKKVNKITVIIVSVIVILNLVFPFIVAIIDNSFVLERSFADDVGYQYETREEAEREYYKFKDHITENKKIYIIVDEGFNTATDECYIELQEIKYNFNYSSKKGYSYLSMNYGSSEIITFKTEEEKEIFEKENVYYLGYYNLSFEQLERNVKFDDETLTISYQKNFKMSGVYDVTPVFILLAFCEILVVFVISAIVYKKKTKNL